MLTVAEIARKFGVTKMAVYLWINDGLEHSKEKIIGRRTRIVIDPSDVVKYHENKVKSKY
jgi:transposase-like protein